MKLLRKRDIPEDRYTNAFLGYGPEDSHFVVELTYSKLCFYVTVLMLMCSLCDNDIKQMVINLW